MGYCCKNDVSFHRFGDLSNNYYLQVIVDVVPDFHWVYFGAVGVVFDEHYYLVVLFCCFSWFVDGDVVDGSVVLKAVLGAILGAVLGVVLGVVLGMTLRKG